jgi:flavin-dependent dehydrogenase
VHTGVRARLGAAGPRWREVILEERGGAATVVRAGVVVDATGLAGALQGSPARPRRASRIGAGALLDEAPASCPPGTVRMATGPGGYVGLVRVEEGRAVVAAALSPGLVARVGGIAEAAGTILLGCRLPVPPGARWRGTPELTRRPERPFGERVVAVGDAAGYVEPFTGEGMAWAMRAALALPPLLAEGWTPATGPRWARLLRGMLAARQGRCRALALLLRMPPLVRALVRLLERAPGLAGPFVRAAAAGSAP